MTNFSPAEHSISWLTDEESGFHTVALAADTHTKIITLPYPQELGRGETRQTILRDGIVLIEDEHQFTGSNLPSQIQLARFSVEFSEPTLAINIIHNGTVFFKNVLPFDGRGITEQELVRNPKTTVFSLTTEFAIEQTVKTNASILASNLLLERNALVTLLGENLTQTLLRNLKTEQLPSLSQLEIPSVISSKVKDCLKNDLQGEIRTLAAQANVFDYLCALLIHLDSVAGEVPVSSHIKQKTIKDLHWFLCNLHGKTPTLRELSQKFGLPTYQLNTLFLQTYGQSIYSYIINNRLDQARSAIELTNIPLKLLADKLGYSHANHFSTAFKRKFGYSPGSLRRGNTGP